jgi:predicted DNA-binding WGR domain protein
MATAKQQPKKVLYHEFFCGDNIGEADGFFEIVDGKLKLVDCWSTNDAHWRGEYMTGLLSWAGVELKDLPEKYQVDGEKLLCENWGLSYGEDEDDDGVNQNKFVELKFQDGSSDKIYNLELSVSAKDAFKVMGHYGRRGGKIKSDVKCTGVSYADAKKVFDQVLAEKIKKGYEYVNAPAYKDDEDEEY